MPCDTIQTSTVTLEMKADNRELLLKALLSVGYTTSVVRDIVYFSKGDVSGQFENGKMSLRGSRQSLESFNANEVKRAYSMQVVQTTAKKFGWQIKQQSEFKFAVQKRGF